MADPTLSDMMTALTRAHGAGNIGDATAIAGMIHKTYPQETSTMLAATPSWSQFNPASPSAWMPQVYRDTGPVASAPALPQAPAPDTSAPPSVNAPNGGGGADSPVGAGSWVQRAGSDIMDFTRSAVGALPGGNQAAAAIGAGARNIASLTGLTTPTTYGDVLSNVQQGQQQAAQNSPIASTLGQVAGNVDAMVLGGAGANALLGAAGRAAIPLLSPAARAAQATATALGARPLVGGAAAGAIGGAIQGATNQINGTGTLLDTGLQAVIGAVGGAVMGKAADLAVTKLAPVAARGWQLLAEKMGSLGAAGQLDALASTDAERAVLRAGLDPAALAQKLADMTKANGGQPPPIAAVLQATAQDAVKRMAANSPAIGNPLADASAAWRAAGPQQVPKLIDDAINGGGAIHEFSPTGKAGVQNVADLKAAQDLAMKSALDPIRGQTVPIDADAADALSDPVVQSAVGGRMKSGLRGRINDAVASVDQNGSGALPVDDVEKLRYTLQRYAGSSDPAIADAATDARNAVRAIGAQNPDYDAALTQFGNHGAYVEGFQQAMAGKSLSEIEDSSRKLAMSTGPAYRQGHASGTVSRLASQAAQSENGAQSVLQTLAQNNSTRDDIVKAYGQPTADRLANVGSQLSQATAALGHVAPGAPVGTGGNGEMANAAARAGLGVATGSHFAFVHNAAHLISGILRLNSVSPQGAVKLGEMLSSTDTRVQAQAIAALRARGAADNDIARIRAYMAAQAGGKTANMMAPAGQ